MDAKFLPAVAAIRAGTPSALAAVLKVAPGLARERSSESHPTLLQCVVLDAAERPAEVQIEMARILRDLGASLDEPLIAAASVGNVTLGAWLLDEGAALDATRASNGWSPLEESLYWDQPAMTGLLLERGAQVATLRAAAGLGRVERMLDFFDGDNVRPDAGGLRSPFGDVDLGGADVRQHVLDNALVYAAMGGHVGAADVLLERGAAVSALPVGFHYRGSALHWAAIRGHAPMCEALVARGADRNLRDLTVEQTPADWAAHGGHEELAAALR